MIVHLYGIPNCDTVRKARSWLDARAIGYVFHDYKKDGADPARLSEWADLVSWDALLNRRGTTFRALAEGDKADIDRVKALRLMAARPSLIKRPVAEYPGGLLVGFSEEEWEATLQ